MRWLWLSTGFLVWLALAAAVGAIVASWESLGCAGLPVSIIACLGALWAIRTWDDAGDE